MWTKAQLIEQAYKVIGLGDYSFDVSAEERQSAVRTLDGMMAMWDGAGVRVGYLLATDEADLATDSGIPDWAAEGVYMNLAIRLGQAQGKQISPDTKANAKAAYSTILVRSVQPVERVPDWRHVPAGAGNRQVVFLAPETEPLELEPDGTLEFGP